LRYDLTIPFARYVAMNHNQLSFPFKRYQIQPVWRADRPQKGRYREFYQCDADVVGTKSLLNEMELICLYNDVFKQLRLDGISICINHRSLLTALATLCGAADKLTSITVAIDKLDKIGIDKVKAELAEKGINNEAIQHITTYLQIKGSNEEIISQLSSLLGKIDQGNDGLHELKTILTGIQKEKIPVKIDPTLARGLNYYTGLILEVKAPATVQMGSIGGGGRYDDLTGLFGVAGIPGVGISFGVDRIYDVMEELNLFPTSVETGTQALFFNLGEKEAQTCFSLLQEIRKTGIKAELYPENIKFDKQFKYAEKKKISYAIIIGDAELTNGVANVKNLETGKQETVPLTAPAIIEALRK
jgi:histidyl-tRNA synthetase